MAMQGNAQHPETESMQMSMFKLNEQDYKMVIGEEQILLHSGKTMLQVNHSQKSIVIQNKYSQHIKKLEKEHESLSKKPYITLEFVIEKIINHISKTKPSK